MEVLINMNELIVEEIKIENMIYEIRGKQVMLDSDLAKLYQCKNGTKEINQAVRNNFEKFPERFSWILSKEEYENLKSKILTSSCKDNYGGRRYNPRVFTEQGVAMLATILKSQIATRVSISIMDAFVSMRKYISNELLEQQHMKNMLLKHDNEIIKNTNEIKLLQESFDKLQNKELINEIYFEGQIYDAYSKILDIMIKAKEEIIIIDNYADKIVLDMISRMKVIVILITRKNNLLKDIDIEKYNKQYNNLTIKYDNTFHDRYIILDKEKVYHCGSSINHIGNKTFSINILQEKEIIDLLINKVVNI